MRAVRTAILAAASRTRRIGAGGAIANPYTHGDDRLSSRRPDGGGRATAPTSSAARRWVRRRELLLRRRTTRYRRPAPLLRAPSPGTTRWATRIWIPKRRTPWTAGFVVQSPWESAGLRGLSATVDWYKISMEDVIEPYSVDYARFLCYGSEDRDERSGSGRSGCIRGLPERAACYGCYVGRRRSRSCSSTATRRRSRRRVSTSRSTGSRT